MIRVILADDHHLVRQGIRALLERVDDIQVIAEAEDGQQAIELVQRLAPDVLVMDISMPRLNGIEAAERIRRLGVSTRVVILSMHSDETLARQALRSGACGYLLKRSVTEELILAIRAASRGEVYLSPGISKLLLDEFSNRQTDAESAGLFGLLTSREREVWQLIAEGQTNPAIAKKLSVSVKTVEKHRASLMSKLKVHDVAGLTRLAIKSKLIALDE
ncbi:MAG: response regulator transcription factor [Chloroflexota bacterium]|nr:response regulator transcription factor [Chloroflexota bacterium]